MKTIDLHLHSYYSDGEDSLRDLLALVASKSFNVFSVTDHNYISSEQNKIRKLAKEQKILFVQGIEVSCIDRETNEPLHILGYSASFDIDKINKNLSQVVKGYNDRAKKIIKKLNQEFNTSFSFEEIKNEIPGVYVSRNYLAQKLSKFLDNKFSSQELLPEVFVNEDNSWMPNAKEVIKFINENNGIVVLAHPGNIASKGHFKDLIERLINSGLKGIEVYFPKHTTDIIDILKETAEKFNLVLTAGSDWHGKNFSKEKMGMLVTDDVYNKLLELFI